MTERKLGEADLRMFTGSQENYAHWLRRFTFTEGVKFLGDRAGAYWLVDAIASHQINPLVRQEPFQCWTLVRTVGTRAVLTMTDGNTGKAICRQEMEFTDFPLGEISLYLVDGVLMLPSEY